MSSHAEVKTIEYNIGFYFIFFCYLKQVQQIINTISIEQEMNF